MGLMLVLVALTACALWVTYTTHLATDELRTIVLASDAVGTARDMAADERSLSNEYRLTGSPEALAAHAAAAAAFEHAFASVHVDGDSDETHAEILAGHAQYMTAAGQMFAALAHGDTAAAETIRIEQVDPLYEAFDLHVDNEATVHRDLAHQHLDAFDALEGWVSTASVVVLALGLSLLGVFWWAFRGLGRRAEFDRAELIRVNADADAEREVVRSKDELVAMVSHELASPATNLVAFAELLATRDYPVAEQQEMLATMVLEGQRMTAIIQEFLDIRRLETGRFGLNPRPMDPLALLTHAATIARRDVDHPVNVDLPAALPLIQADPGRVQQILANLLSNARKYTPAGREIRLGARQVGGLVEVYVADDGLGIPADALPRVFETFYRVPGEDHRAHKGTGLGLAITRELIEAQGGQIGVESDGPGHGSRFWFTLPVAHVESVRADLDVTQTASTPDVLPSAVVRLPGAPARPVRLLAVDDDAAIGCMVRRVLRSRGYDPVITASAEEALERLQTEPFDIVLSDLGLGSGMDGWELAARVRQNWNIPFVLSTGSVGIDPNDARQRGVDGLISKPYLPVELLELLGRLAPADTSTRAA
jgi:signal transduction histidine kinase